MKLVLRYIVCISLALALSAAMMGNALAAPLAAPAGAEPSRQSFYFQLDSRWSLPSGGCWITSYAMVIHRLGIPATPKTVFLANGRSVNCYHAHIRKQLGVKPVDLRPLSHSLFSAYSPARGATYIRNSSKSASNVIKAIKLALKHHPEGVMVRFQGKPHTIVATGYRGNTVYFNDPGMSKGANIPFSKTCVYRAGFRWTDVSFIQALAK
jgi:hypothetical protein